MVRALIRTGLLIIAIAVAALIAADTQTNAAYRDLAKKGLLLGAILCGSGLVLAFLMRVLNLSSTRRCPRCRKRVPRGHIYCEDHFQEALSHARDRFRP